MNTVDQHAKNSLRELVAHVLAHQSGLIKGLTYSELAFRIGRRNKHGEGHGHGMGDVLGKMGHMLEGLEGEWGEPIPHIQSLVINKSGALRDLPDEGIREFWPDYPKMTVAEKENRTQIEYQRIIAFGSRWNDVLDRLGLEKATPQVKPRQYGGGGESPEHKALKEFIRNHPEIVGAGIDWESYTEYPLPSLDEIDVVFKSPNACISVEVKSRISDDFPMDYERGLYQTIKYHALLAAMALDKRYDIPSEIRSLLVLESKLPEQYRDVVIALGIEVIENVKVQA